METLIEKVLHLRSLSDLDGVRLGSSSHHENPHKMEMPQAI
jgi:hypothetical protein